MSDRQSLTNWAEALPAVQARACLRHAEACVDNTEHPFWDYWMSVAEVLRPIVLERPGPDVIKKEPCPKQNPPHPGQACDSPHDA